MHALIHALRTLEEPGAMAARAIVVYVAGLVILRFARQRLLGRTTVFDIVLAFIPGSLFSRAINGGSPVGATLTAAVVPLLLHWGIGYLGRGYAWFDSLAKGRCVELVRIGAVNTCEGAMGFPGDTTDPSPGRRNSSWHVL